MSSPPPRVPHPCAGATAIIEEGWRWHVLADTEGNEFCVLQPPGPAGHE